MHYAFMRDVAITDAQYAEVQAGVEAVTGGEPPKGLVAHLALRQQGGLRYIDVWESQADWERFRDEDLNPIVLKTMERHGIERPSVPIPMESIDVVHAWVGASV